ncbi:MAG: S9 family peptidase [Oscillochloris sp.]|nr:S9 family peptidase [Oscillochloris sp.]
MLVSHRTGRPEVFAELRDGADAGRLLQLTEHDAISEWSVHPSPDGRWVAFVHTYEDNDCLALVAADGSQWPQQLLSGYDFVMQPCWHPAGAHLALIVWDHPNMPWDATRLLLLSLETTASGMHVRATQQIAGDDTTAIFQPSFSPDGRWLAYISDASGWGRIMLYDLDSGEAHQLTDADAEHGQPAWAQGMRSFAWARDSARIYYLQNRHGIREVLVQPVAGGPPQSLSAGLGYTWFEQPAASPVADALAGIASSSRLPARIVLADSDRTRIIRRSAADPLPAERLAVAESVSWPAEAGPLHAMLYLPPDRSTATALPAIVRLHGGPSDQATASYQAEAQFFATRGFAVLDLNYRGSTGYGRAYLQALREHWGEADVADTLSAAQYLVASGIADPNRLVVMGGSAGGLTALLALCTAPGTFRAAVCRYPVVDMLALTEDTHKFEARYLDRLVGPLPETFGRYRERSPLLLADKIRDAVAIFQGADDPVVPPAQVEQMAQALRRHNIPFEYQVFPGEGHGFRKPETIATYYSAVTVFLERYIR